MRTAARTLSAWWVVGAVGIGACSGSTDETNSGQGGAGGTAGNASGGTSAGHSGSAAQNASAAGGGAGKPSGSAGTAAGAPVGSPCLLADENFPQFSGYTITDVNLQTQSPQCDSGICLANHFQGRVSCPYGQTTDELAAAPECFLPRTTTAVSVAVDPQLLARRASDTVICSCRCDGPDSGPFCTCPSNMECTPLVMDLGLPGEDTSLVGSYCIPQGTAYDPNKPLASATCDRGQMNCNDPGAP